jgi:hypothetical protein
MPDGAWILLGLGSASLAGLGAALGRRRSRRRAATVAGAAAQAPAAVRSGLGRSDHPAPTVVEAELQLALLLRRMRAYLRDPYDVSRSRIADDAEFEGCLDLAAALRARVADLCGAGAAEPGERERMRGQILEGLTAGRRAEQ